MRTFHLYLALTLFISVREINAASENAEKNHDPSSSSTISRNAKVAAIQNSTPSSKLKNNLNVVLFVMNVPDNYTFDNKLKDVWNFDVAQMMKSCISAITLKRISRGQPKKSSSSLCECQFTFKRNLLSLMDWARETAGMLTALVSLTPHGYSDSISSEVNRNGEHYGYNYFNFKLQSSGDGSDASNGNENYIGFPLRLQKEAGNSIAKPDEIDDVDDDVNVVRSPTPLRHYKPVRKRFWTPYQLETIKNSLKLSKYDLHPRQKTGEDAFVTERDKMKGRDYQASSKHPATATASVDDTTVGYLIDANDSATTSDRNDVTEETRTMDNMLETLIDYSEPPPAKEPSSVEELSDIMASIKKQFFNELMDDSQKDGHKMEPFKQPTMLDLVRITFNRTYDTKRPFLLLFMGGNATDLNDPSSDLSESLQYLLDNVKEGNTVIVLSGNCVETAENEDMDEDGDAGNTVPLFALGPDAESEYNNVKDLCNLPETIRTSIDRHKARTRRKKRDRMRKRFLLV